MNLTLNNYKETITIASCGFAYDQIRFLSRKQFASLTYLLDHLKSNEPGVEAFGI